MTTLSIEINSGSAAFADAPHLETARILREIANNIENGGGGVDDYISTPIRDVNGNSCGYVSFDPEPKLLNEDE